MKFATVVMLGILEDRSARINQQVECSWSGSALWCPLLRLGSRSHFKIRCVHQEVVRLWIERHGLRPELGLHRLDHTELVRRILVEYVDRALARRNGHQSGGSVI